MSDLSVWAPFAKQRVTAVVNEQEFALTARDGGWWAANVPAAVAGADYAFRIDNGNPLPDPRSPWQPNGVHAPSRLYDHAAYDWHDRGWAPPTLGSAVIYELHIGTFSPAGTCDGAIEKLDYLVDLGITHVELLPVNAFNGEHGWGYDGVDLFSVHEPYGGPDGLKRLVDACHARGLAVIMDVVYNHLGPSGNYLGQFGPYFSDRYGTPWGPAVNFDDAHSHEVRRFVIDNALMWLRDYHCDGLRIDAVHAILDTSAVHILEELAIETRQLEAQLGRSLVLIAESSLNDPRVVSSIEAGGYGLHAQWNDDLHHALRTVLTGDQDGYFADFHGLADVAKALREAFVLDGRFSPFRQRYHGRPIGDLPATRFITYIQTHDQVGNRAQGDRLGHAISTAQLKVAAALMLAAPTIPMLFQGEEWNATAPFQYFTSHPEPDLAGAVRNGRRREFAAFGWDAEDVPDPQDPATFERSKLDWAELERAVHAEMHAWYRHLIALRRSDPDLLDDRFSNVAVEFDADAAWLVMRRGAIVVACNFSKSTRTVPLGNAPTALLMHSAESAPDLAANLELAPESVAIVRV